MKSFLNIGISKLKVKIKMIFFCQRRMVTCPLAFVPESLAEDLETKVSS